MRKEKFESTQNRATGAPWGKALQVLAWVALTISGVIQLVTGGHTSPTLTPPPFTPLDIREPTALADFAATLASLGAEKTAPPAAPATFTPTATLTATPEETVGPLVDPGS